MNEYTTLNEIKQKIGEHVPQEQNEHPPFVGRVKNKVVSEILDREKFIKSFVERGDEICAFERMAVPPNSGDNFFLCEVKIAQHKKSYMFFSGVQQIAQSRLMIL